jgi:hypothetical protein
VISVEPISGADDDRVWDAFVLATPGGLLFHSSAYRDLLVEHLGCEAEYLTARRGGEIAGALPIMWTGEHGKRICNSLPFYGSHGGIVGTDPEATEALLAAWNERAAGDETLSATMVANPFRDDEHEPPAHTLTDQRIGQVTRLPEPDPEALMGVYTKNGRRDVRRAQRRGVDVARDATRLDDVGRLHAENIRSIGGTPKSAEFFAAIPRHFEPSEGYDVWVATIGDEMVAGMLVFYFGRVAEYFTPAVEPEHRADEPMAAILLEAMTEAARRGFRDWNWGGTWTAQDGVYRFKRKWGAEDRPYRYFVQVNDESLLDETPERLLERYPHFYVAPFSELRSGPPAHVGENT